MPDLYHYCSTDTFVSIISNQSIRLSSLTLSNDSKEGELIKEHLMQLAQDASVNSSALINLKRILQFTYKVFDGLGFCLSENGDLLSQWRGYADDGHGVSIGFRSEYLEELAYARLLKEEASFSLKQLEYDSSRHAEVAKKHFENLRPFLDQGAFKSTAGSLLAPITDEEKAEIKKQTDKASLVTLAAMMQMFELKHPAFKEELEWRLISFSINNSDHAKNRFRPCRSRVVPYLEVPLQPLSQPAISTVYLGPRHTTPPHVIKQMLRSSGFGEPAVIESAATYR